MRLFDLVQPYLNDVTSVIDVSGVDHQTDFHLLAPLEYRLLEPDQTHGLEPSSNAVLILPAQASRWPHALQETVRTMPVDAILLLLSEDEPHELGYHEFLDQLVRADFQVTQVAPLEGASALVGVVARRVEELELPRNYFGESTGNQRIVAGLATTLRIAGERVLGDFVERASRLRITSTEQRLAALTGRVEELRADLRSNAERLSALETAFAQLESDPLERQLLRLEKRASRVWKEVRAASRRRRSRTASHGRPE